MCRGKCAHITTDPQLEKLGFGLFCKLVDCGMSLTLDQCSHSITLVEKVTSKHEEG